MLPTWDIRQGDVLERLREVPDESIHCVVTSPPYWGLRDYGLPASIWAGDPTCEHKWGEGIKGRTPGDIRNPKSVLTTDPTTPTA